MPILPVDQQLVGQEIEVKVLKKGNDVGAQVNGKKAYFDTKVPQVGETWLVKVRKINDAGNTFFLTPIRKIEPSAVVAKPQFEVIFPADAYALDEEGVTVVYPLLAGVRFENGQTEQLVKYIAGQLRYFGNPIYGWTLGYAEWLFSVMLEGQVVDVILEASA